MLLDLRMPGLDGHEVMARLPPDGPRVVLLTSAGMDEVQQALATRPHYYLPKDRGPGRAGADARVAGPLSVRREA